MADVMKCDDGLPSSTLNCRGSVVACNLAKLKDHKLRDYWRLFGRNKGVLKLI